MPILGTLCQGLQSIFINRGGTEEERNQIVETIMARQIEIEDSGRRFNPICIFPEGTTTNGNYLLNFKRGAFQAMRTIQPCFVKMTYNHIRPTHEGPDVGCLVILLLSNLGFTVSTLYIMPPFVPNQHMLDKHQDKGEFDWEIYAWCVRDAMAKAGGFELSDMSNRERMKYWNYMNKFADSCEHQGRTFIAPDVPFNPSTSNDKETPLL